jgi:acylglycerol lipase
MALESWAADGNLVAVREVPLGARAAVLYLHGFAEHAGRHAPAIGRLAARGLAVYIYDHRGHGRSPGARGLVKRFDALVDDVAAMRARIAAEQPGLLLFLVGASMGGLMAIRSAEREPAGLAGVVAIAPALAIGGNEPAFVRAIAPLLAKIAPALPAAKLDVRFLARDQTVGESFVADPLTFKGGVPVASAVAMIGAGAAAIAEAPRFRLPILILQGDRDRIVSPSGSQRFIDAVGSTDATLRVVPGGYHEPFNDPGGEALVDEVADWILARAPAVA